MHINRKRKIIRFLVSCLQIKECAEVIQGNWINELPIDELKKPIKQMLHNSELIKKIYLDKKDSDVVDFFELLSEYRIQILEECEKIQDEATCLALLQDFNNNKVTIANEWTESIEKEYISKVQEHDKERFIKHLAKFKHKTD